MRSWEQEIRQDSEQKRTDMSQKERPHQGDTERIESQAPGYEVVQNWDTVSGVLRTCCNGHVPEFYPTQKDYGSRLVAAKGSRLRALRQSCTSMLEKTGDPAIWFPLVQLRTWLELQGEEMEHRLGKIDVARAWAAASGNMKKKSRWSMVKGANDCDNDDLARPQHHPSLSMEMVIQLKTQTLNGPTLVVTLALSSMRCNKDSPTKFGNKLHCTITVSVRKMVSTWVLHKHHKQLLARGAHVKAGMLYKIATAQIYDGP